MSKQAESNAVEVAEEVPNEYSDFPFCMTTCLEAQQDPAHLLKSEVELELFGEKKTVQALFDGGSTHSFISPWVLSKNQRKQAIASCPRKNFTIRSATGSVKNQCCIAEMRMGLNDWHGSHKFIITNSGHKHEAIIGRDFLKANAASINHGDDILEFHGKQIRLSEGASVTETNTVCINHISVEMKTVKETIVKANSQHLVELCCDTPTTGQDGIVLFEPATPLPHNCLVSRSAHKNSCVIFCNVVNTDDRDLKLPAGQLMGSTSEIEQANIVFNEKVANFKPLDVDKVREEARSPTFNLDDKYESMISDKLTDEQRRMLHIVLSAHEDAFQWDKGKLGRTNLVEHQIETGDAKPIQQRQYPIPTKALDEVREQTSKMLKEKIIRPSNSP